MASTFNLGPQAKWQEWKTITINGPQAVKTFTVNTTTDIITLNSSANFLTGKAVQVVTSGTLPAPLVDGAFYYLIAVTSTTYQLATTIANAQAGTEINFTTAGTGTLYLVSSGQTFQVPLAGGQISTFSSQNHANNKPTYLDPLGENENENPTILDGRGQAVIYWEINETDPTDNYYVEVRDENGVLLYTFDDYNASPLEEEASTNGGGTQNFLTNSQFTFMNLFDYGALSPIANVSTMPSAGFVETFNEWYYTKSNNSATDSVSKIVFSPGQTAVPNSPFNYAQISCTVAGTGETYKQFYQPLANVQTFNGEVMNVSFYAISQNSGNVLNVSIVQNFGSGGSPTVTTNVFSQALTTSFEPYQYPVTIPSTEGMTIGAGSYLAVLFNFPLNSLFQIGISEAQLTLGAEFQPFQQLTYQQQFTQLPEYTTEASGAIKCFPQAINTALIPRTWTSLASTTNLTIGNASSGATGRANPDTQSLFFMLWTNYTNTQCPVFTSAGVPIARGASASADFTANRRIQMFYPAGKNLAVAGNSTDTIAVAVDPTNDTFATADNVSLVVPWTTGQIVQVSSTATLPAPLVAATDYRVIYFSFSGTPIYKLAATLDDALNGTPINITTAGTGTITLSRVLTTNNTVAGSFGGDQLHYQLLGEVAAHDHETFGNDVTPGRADGADSDYVPSTTTGTANGMTSSTGDNEPMSIINPTLWLPYIIKL